MLHHQTFNIPLDLDGPLWSTQKVIGTMKMITPMIIGQRKVVPATKNTPVLQRAVAMKTHGEVRIYLRAFFTSATDGRQLHAPLTQVSRKGRTSTTG